MMVIGQTALAVVSNKAKAFVKASNKRFYVIKRQFLNIWQRYWSKCQSRCQILSFVR
jgi:hypothetical protein